MLGRAESHLEVGVRAPLTEQAQCTVERRGARWGWRQHQGEQQAEELLTAAGIGIRRACERLRLAQPNQKWNRQLLQPLRGRRGERLKGETGCLFPRSTSARDRRDACHRRQRSPSPSKGPASGQEPSRALPFHFHFHASLRKPICKGRALPRSARTLFVSLQHLLLSRHRRASVRPSLSVQTDRGLPCGLAPS